ncbi:MAG: GNAT family N-acetyltransferase [Candidatus Aminicenantes bacterium]|nr:GNAT family N-acetyltransferase [Candidatus Aminicenantes bacterium]
MEIKLRECTVRSWKKEDADSVARHADNRKIWINLRDAFPHPYTISDAQRFIDLCLSMEPETYFCIDRGNEAIGSIGFGILTDVARFSAEIGYWLGEQYWGRGIMTEALKAVTDYAFSNHGLHRVFALPYEWNQASIRVLEKAGYEPEVRMRCSAFKDGKLIDQFLYAYTRE